MKDSKKRTRDTMPAPLKKLDERWQDVMEIAKECGFIVQAAGGTAILITQANQYTEISEADHHSNLRMNGICPADVELECSFECTHCFLKS